MLGLDGMEVVGSVLVYAESYGDTVCMLIYIYICVVTSIYMI